MICKMTYRSLLISKYRLILQVLLPIRIMKGIMPSDALFKRFPRIRRIYESLVHAIKQGNVKGFGEALDTSGEILLRQGTYFPVEEAQSIVVRRLFRKV